MILNGLVSLIILNGAVWAQEKMAGVQDKPQVSVKTETSLAAVEKLFSESREMSKEVSLKSESGANLGDARLTVNDWHGEPVARDVFIKLEVKCAGQSSYKVVGPAFNTCRFLGVDHDRKRGILVIRYHSPTVINGEFGCGSKASAREYKIDCKN